MTFPESVLETSQEVYYMYLFYSRGWMLMLRKLIALTHLFLSRI